VCEGRALNISSSGQPSGELDDALLVDGKAGERLVFKRRAQADAPDSPITSSSRLRLVVDISGSMTRFNGYDGRLSRSLEAVLVVMEALSEQTASDRTLDVSIQGHSGDSASIELVGWDGLPRNRAERLAVLQQMVTHSAYCWSGDHTLSAIQAATKAVQARAAASGEMTGTPEGTGGTLGCVLVLSDANLKRYRITPSALGAALGGVSGVEGFVILVGSLGNEAAAVAAGVPEGRAVCLEDTAALPALVGELFAHRLIPDV
jgi:hypothetical protein